MRSIRRATLAALLMISLLPTSQGKSWAAPATTEISLSQAWIKVTADSDALAALREEVEEAKHQKSAAADLYWPEVGLGANYLYLDDDITLSPSQILDSMEGGAQLAPLMNSLAASYGMSAAQLEHGLTSTVAERQQLASSLRAYWPLYTGGRIEAAQEGAAGKQQEADARLQQGTGERFETLVQYYFSTVLAKLIHDTRQAAENGLRQHRDHAVLLEGQGQIARVERMQSEASLDKATVERRKALRDLEIARAALARILKSGVMVEPADQLFLNSGLPELEVFIDQALAGHPGLAVLAAKREQAEALVKAEKGRYLPTMGVFGNYSVYEEESLATELMPDWLVGVSVNLPLIDRSGRSGKLKSAESSVRRVELLTAQAKSDISLLVEKNYRQAEQALEEYRGLGSSLELAEETVQLRKKAFSQGVSTSLDVVDAELFLASVRAQRAAAVYHYVVALAGLCGASGQPERFFEYQLSESKEVH